MWHFSMHIAITMQNSVNSLPQQNDEILTNYSQHNFNNVKDHHFHFIKK